MINELNLSYNNYLYYINLYIVYNVINIYIFLYDKGLLLYYMRVCGL